MTLKLDSKINNIWLSSDWHYAHSNIVRYAERPFKDVDEMNEALIVNYNSLVSDKDIVFFLGDIAFGGDNVQMILGRMKGNIHYILGNHDKRYVDIIKRRCTTVNDLLDIEIDSIPITLCHYAMRVWNKSHFDSWNLVGHSHARLEPIGKQWDVGVDNNGFKPLSFADIVKIMETRPHNENYLPEEKRVR